MDFDAFMGQAWSDHGEQAAAVAQRLREQALPHVREHGDAAAISRLARLAQHVHGEHLGQWQAGRLMLDELARLPACDAPTALLLQRWRAGLALAAGEPGARAALAPSERIAASASAAACLAERDAARAQALFQQALDEADAAALADSDPAVRALAVSGWNLACTLEEKPGRSSAERELMITAAQASRRFWGRCGTWLEAERGEYRLAMTWLQAGDAARALGHAQACLRAVRDNASVPLELFFGLEALALAQSARGDAAAAAAAAREADAAYEALNAADQGWCEPTRTKLRALVAAAGA